MPMDKIDSFPLLWKNTSLVACHFQLWCSCPPTLSCPCIAMEATAMHRPALMKPEKTPKEVSLKKKSKHAINTCTKKCKQKRFLMQKKACNAEITELPCMRRSNILACLMKTARDWYLEATGLKKSVAKRKLWGHNRVRGTCENSSAFIRPLTYRAGSVGDHLLSADQRRDWASGLQADSWVCDCSTYAKWT